ncbi:MAG: hypothetical protein RMK29_01645 [Myxococcales bacterium]|nr:hypothetical protein [Myxococcota bacterium]MDW8280383.1 hypothetical protein [Myxococcales bacterium]
MKGVGERAILWRRLGLGLLGAGLVLGLLGAARLEVSGTLWRARPAWPLFSLGVGLLALAAVLVRRHPAGGGGDGDGTDQVAAILRELRAAVAALRQGHPLQLETEGRRPAALQALAEAEAPQEAAYLLWLKLQLDPLLDDLLPRLFDARSALLRQHGVVTGGVFVSGLARVERLLARAWSAAVDGHAPAARAALAEAAQELEGLALPEAGGRPPGT